MEPPARLVPGDARAAHPGEARAGAVAGAECYHLRMIAAVLRGPRSLDVTSVPSPTPGPNDAVIRVTAAGLCGTDYRIWTGERPVRYPEHWRRYRGRFVRVRARTLKGHPRAQIVDVPDDRHVVLRLADQSEITLELGDLREALLVPDESGPDPLFRK